MSRKFCVTLLGGLLALAAWVGSADTAKADQTPLPRYSYYPYYYFPHSYWPTQGPKWPQSYPPFSKTPAYMAYPPFREPGWRYNLYRPMKYYRGFHFWLDQF